MTLLRFVLSIFVFVVSIGFGAKIPKNPVLSKYAIIQPAETTLAKIAQQFEIIKKTATGYEVLVPVPQQKKFLKLIPSATLLEEDFEHRMDFAERAAGFHTFATVKSHLDQIVSAHPEIASLETYGKSMEGRPLYALRLLSKNGAAKKTQLAFTSATHGNEISTVEVVFGILDYLVNQYGKVDRITNLVDTHELYFLPVINPDGYVVKQRYANGVDPNRDYPYPDMPVRNPNPCIKSVMDFFAAHEIKASIDFHSEAAMIMYPWAYTLDSVPSADKSFFTNLTKKMASFNQYAYGQISKIIYVAKGSSADYYYWKFGTKALGIELSQEGSASIIPLLVNENLESTLTFIESF